MPYLTSPELLQQINLRGLADRQINQLIENLQLDTPSLETDADDIILLRFIWIDFFPHQNGFGGLALLQTAEGDEYQLKNIDTQVIKEQKSVRLEHIASYQSLSDLMAGYTNYLDDLEQQDYQLKMVSFTIESEVGIVTNYPLEIENRLEQNLTLSFLDRNRQTVVCPIENISIKQIK